MIRLKVTGGRGVAPYLSVVGWWRSPFLVLFYVMVAGWSGLFRAVALLGAGAGDAEEVADLSP